MRTGISPNGIRFDVDMALLNGFITEEEAEEAIKRVGNNKMEIMAKADYLNLKILRGKGKRWWAVVDEHSSLYVRCSNLQQVLSVLQGREREYRELANQNFSRLASVLWKWGFGESALYDDPIIEYYGADGFVAEGFKKRLADFKREFFEEHGVPTHFVTDLIKERVSARWIYFHFPYFGDFTFVLPDGDN